MGKVHIIINLLTCATFCVLNSSIFKSTKISIHEKNIYFFFAITIRF